MKRNTWPYMVGSNLSKQKVRWFQKFSSSCWINFNKPANKPTKRLLEVGFVATKKRSNPPHENQRISSENWWFPSKRDAEIPTKYWRVLLGKSENPKKKLVSLKIWWKTRVLLGQPSPKIFLGCPTLRLSFVESCLMLAWLHMLFFPTFATFFFLGSDILQIIVVFWAAKNFWGITNCN